jgi:hypothetical protein
MATKAISTKKQNTINGGVKSEDGETVSYSFQRPTRLGRLQLNSLYNLIVAGIDNDTDLGLATIPDVELYCLCSYSQSVAGLKTADGIPIEFPQPNAEPTEHNHAFELLMQVEDDLFMMLSKDAKLTLKGRFADPTLLPDSQLTTDQQSDRDLKKSESENN